MSVSGPVIQNFLQISPRGLLGKWVKYTQKFLFMYVFFSSTHPQVRPLKYVTTRAYDLIFCFDIWRATNADYLLVFLTSSTVSVGGLA